MKIDCCKPGLRVLCISPLFAPSANAEAFVSTKIVRAMQQLGVSVTVVSSSNLYHGLRQDSSGMWDSARDKTVDILQLDRPDPIRSAAAVIRFQTPSYARWVEIVVKIAKELHAANNFDLVYSRSLPMAAHIAGFWCAKTLRLPWVVSINDPWDFRLYHHRGISAFAARTQMFWLRRTLSTADLVTYPCKGLHNFHAKLAKFDHRAEIIPHIGYSPKSIGKLSDSRFRLVHAGMLGSHDQTGRSAKVLLSGLKQFLESSPEAAIDTKLVLVGPEDNETQSQILELGLERNVENVGSVCYEDSLTHIASASACILVETIMEEGIFLPSKLADYIVCRKPILAVSPPHGTAADLANQNELLLASQKDPSAVHAAIRLFYTDFKRGTLNLRKPSDRLIAQLQPQSVAAKLLTACRSFVSVPVVNYGSPPAESGCRSSILLEQDV